MFKSKFQALVVRRGYKRAIIAIGYKMRARCSSCLSDASITGIARRIMKRSVQRNAPRWIKALTRFGFITPASA